jgi:hypothetical protein
MYVGYAISTKKGFFTLTTIDNLVLQSLDTYAGYDLSENTIYIEYMNVQIIIYVSKNLKSMIQLKQFYLVR